MNLLLKIKKQQPKNSHFLCGIWPNWVSNRDRSGASSSYVWSHHSYTASQNSVLTWHGLFVHSTRIWTFNSWVYLFHPTRIRTFSTRVNFVSPYWDSNLEPLGLFCSPYRDLNLEPLGLLCSNIRTFNHWIYLLQLTKIWTFNPFFFSSPYQDFLMTRISGFHSFLAVGKYFSDNCRRIRASKL